MSEIYFIDKIDECNENIKEGKKIKKNYKKTLIETKKKLKGMYI